MDFTSRLDVAEDVGEVHVDVHVGWTLTTTCRVDAITGLIRRYAGGLISNYKSQNCNQMCYKSKRAHNGTAPAAWVG